MNNLAGDKKYKAKIEKMQKELFKWMEEQGDTGANLDKPFQNRAEVARKQITVHDRAVLVKPGRIRDPYRIRAIDQAHAEPGEEEVQTFK